MRKTAISTIFLGLVSITISFAQNIGVKDDSLQAYEMPRTQVITINNSETNAQDVLYVKLPEGYAENSDMEYPVLYFTHPAQHIEILSAATETLIEDVILVGVTFQKGMTFRTVDSYMDFMRNDVFETVENSYRADADRRTYFGYSSGALVGAYILSKHPNAFKNFILGSPALGGDSTVTQQIYEFGSTANGQKELNANVFVSYGESEKEVDKQHFEEFITLLENLKDESLTFKHMVVEGDHRTSFPMTAIQGVTWLADLIKDSDSPPDSYRDLESPYLGQKPPGLKAEVFAPGLVSTELYELFSAFTPDMKEFYFVRYDEEDKPSMIVYKYQNNEWKSSVTGPRVGEPFISPDGKTMHLGRKYMERTDTGWSELKSLGTPYEDMRIMRLTTSEKGTYFFDTAGEEPIRYSRLTGGKRGEPQTLNIDLGLHNAHPWIAPDESYLIWDDQREEGYGGADLYISFRQQNGSWGPSINLGDQINSEESDFYPTITPDGKYLLFNRNIDENNVDVYWVSTEIIETLRPN